MQCSRMILFAQAIYNKCLRTTDCNLVCSLEQESHTAPFMLSIHSPDSVFMVLVSIFISNHNHFCVLLAAARATTAYDVLKYWTQFAKDVRMYVHTYCCTMPSLCLGTPVPRQKVHLWTSWMLSSDSCFRTSCCWITFPGGSNSTSAMSTYHPATIGSHSI